MIKIRLQLQSREHTTTLHGTLRTFTTLVRNEGIRGLWKGNIPASILYPLYSGVQFTAYHQITAALASLPRPPPEHTINFLAGGTAGCVATTFTYPLDLLRTRLAAAQTAPSHASPSTTHHGPTPRALSAAIRALARENPSNPLRPYFRGLGAGLASIFPYMGLFFLGYEALKAALPHSSSWVSTLGAPDAVAGTLASVASKTVVFPLDTVRKRLQVQGQVAGRAFPVHRGGVVRTMWEVVARDGVRGLYRGLGIGLVKAAPAGAVTIWAFERCMAVMRKIEQLEENQKSE